MLQNLREAFIGTTGKVVLGVILLLLAGTGLNYTITPKPFVAKVDGEEIPLRRVNAVYRQLISQFGNQQLPEELLRQVQAEAVNRVVTETALAGHLAAGGYAVSDAQVASRLREYPDFQDESGVFDAALYRRLLAQNSLSPAGFEADERQRMVITQLQENLAASAFVTPEEFRRVVELSNEQREVEYALLAPSLFVDGVSVTDAEIASWYESNPTRYQTEAQAAVDYVLVDRALARERVEVDEAALRAYFDANSATFEGTEQRRASHVLLRTNDDADVARERATSLLARIRAGEPFEDIARSNSQDGGTARQGGDLGWLSRGDYPAPAVEEAIFALSPGGVSDIVESDFGLHIIRLEEVRSGGTPAFEAVANDVRDQFIDERESQSLLELEEQLADQLFESDTLEQIAEAVGVAVQRVDAFSEGALIPFGRSDAIDAAVFGAEAIEAGALSDVIELPGDRTVILRVATRTPAGREPLEAVADSIRAELTERAAADVAAERGAQIAAALNAEPTATFDALLVDSGAEYVAPRQVGRSDREAPAALVAAVFAADVPEDGVHVGSVSAPGVGFVVYRVSGVTPGDPAELTPEQIDAARQQFALRRGTSDMQALTQGVLEDTSVKIGKALETQVDGF